MTIVSSSVRVERKTHKVAKVLFDLATERNIEASLVDLQTIDLPEFGKPLNEHKLALKNQLQEQLMASEAFIFEHPSIMVSSVQL